MTDTADTLAPAIMEEGKAESEATTSFVDYTPPPRPPVPPPAKYKLCLVIWFTVYFVSWFATEAGIVSTFIKGGLNLYGALFCLFLIEIFVMIFCGVELVIGLSRIKICGTWYGTLPWLMQPRCQWVKKSDNVLVEIFACFVTVAEDGFAIFNPAVIPPAAPKPKLFDLMGNDKAVLRAKHNIDPERDDDYEKWCENMIRCMESQHGFIAAEKESVENGVHTWKLQFNNVVCLNNCMGTPAWVKMVQDLDPMLRVRKVTQIQIEHPPTNAFMDLLTRQGETTPALPPKKWKVWFATVCSIFFSSLIVSSTLNVYYTKWGMDNWDPNLRRIVDIGSLVLCLNYITTPAILLYVNNWIVRKPNEMDTKFPWKQLNDGVIPPFQLVGFLAYFISTGVVWATKV